MASEYDALLEPKQASEYDALLDTPSNEYDALLEPVAENPTPKVTDAPKEIVTPRSLGGKPMTKEAALRQLESIQQGVRPEGNIVERVMAPLAAGVANAGDTAIQAGSLTFHSFLSQKASFREESGSQNRMYPDRRKPQ
jgi:hypothetical protein